MARITIPHGVTRIRIGSGKPIAVEPGTSIDVPDLPETGSEWHEGTGPLVQPEMKLCPMTPYVKLTTKEDGSDDVTTFLRCEECGAEFKPGGDGVFCWPVPCMKANNAETQKE
jgi:hypothetical protein